MPQQDLIADAPITRVRIQIDPVQHAINSLLLLSMADEKPGMSEWVQRTADELSPDVRQKNELVMVGLYYTVLPTQNWNSFPEYLEHLQRMSADALSAKLMNGYENLTCTPVDPTAPQRIDPQAALTSPENYLAYLHQRFSEDHIDEHLERQAYTYATNPAALKQLIVSHLQYMWTTYLEAEWDRVQPMLRDSVQAFQQVDFSRMSLIEAARFVTGQELPNEKWEQQIETAEQIVFLPSAHIGPYLWSFRRGKTLGLLFGARLPSGTTYRAPDLSRAELLTRLSALADDCHLRILKYIADHGEQRSQDIMTRLDFSQSAASRHLTQLCATGFLNERRCDGAKCYRLNLDRIEETSQALRTYLKAAKRSRKELGMFNWYATQRIEKRRLEEELIKVQQDSLIRQANGNNWSALKLHQRLLTRLGAWMVSFGCRLQSRYDHLLTARQANYLPENDPFVSC